MKFIYLDESGTGDDPFAVMAAVIVDGNRMHVTKRDWADLLRILSKLIGRQIKEFHTRGFYSGNGAWRNIDGKMRASIISEILVWLKKRKHKISFCGIDKNKYFSDVSSSQKLKDIGSLWCMLGLHQLLITQKQHQSGKGAKGHTIFIFDEEVKEKERIINLVCSPPDWTNSYYSKKSKEEALNQIIDVPYFGDSEKVNLLQVADLIAYIVRRYVEIKEEKISPRYYDELEKIDSWMKTIVKLSLPSASRYMKVGRCDCGNLFYEYAPKSLVNL